MLGFWDSCVLMMLLIGFGVVTAVKAVAKSEVAKGVAGEAAKGFFHSLFKR